MRGSGAKLGLGGDDGSAVGCCGVCSGWTNSSSSIAADDDEGASAGWTAGLISPNFSTMSRRYASSNSSPDAAIDWSTAVRSRYRVSFLAIAPLSSSVR